MRTRNLAWVVASVAVVATTAFGAAAIGLLLPGERATSTLAPAGERKTIGFAGVEGSSLSIDAWATKGSAVKPKITLLAPDGSPVDVGNTNPKSKGRAHCRVASLGATGVWRIGVETPSDAGGSFALSTSARVPLKASWSGTLDASGAPNDRVVAAAPGGAMTATVSSKGKPLFNPTVDVLSPAGGLVAHVVGVRGRAVVVGAPLLDLGRYVVRVTGAAGSFKATAVVRPAKKRAPAYRDVEARPEVRGFSPGTAANDSVVTISLDGLGFSTQQTVSIAAGARTAAARIARIVPGGAEADVNLDDVPPGSYPLYVTTAEGNATLAATQIAVTNRPPGVTSIYPFEVSNYAPTPIDVRGAGFDATASVSLTRASDGAAVPFSITSRTGHTALMTTIAPTPYFTGACDLDVVDPDGGHVVVHGAVDVLGFKRAPVSVRTLQGGTTAYTRDAAYDEVNDRVLLACNEGTSRTFVLFDAKTMAQLDVLTFLGSTGANPPRVAWNGRDGTFALSTSTYAAAGNAGVTVVSAQNIHQTLGSKLFGSGYTQQAHAAANPDGGGYLLVWDDYDAAAKVGRIKTQVVAADGTIDVATQSVVFSLPEQGYVAEPVCKYQGGGRFVVAWISSTMNNTFYAAYDTVVDAAGKQTLDAGPYVAGTDGNWLALFQPELARNPTDGSMLLAYSYYTASDSKWRPACQLLRAGDAHPGSAFTLDGDGLLPEGLLDCSAWDADRAQFVVTMTTVGSRVAVRRVNPDASIRPTAVTESYEGVWGILYGGTKPGTLGLARTFDGVDDGVMTTVAATYMAFAAPIR